MHTEAPQTVVHLKETSLETHHLVFEAQATNQTMSAAVWPFHWLTELKGALPAKIISEKQYPKVFAWIGRFRQAIANAKAIAPKPMRLKGADAIKKILAAGFAEADEALDSNDPTGLQRGEDVQVWPTDSGFLHKDRGRLVSLTADEVVIATQSKVGGKEVHIRTPRHGFRIARATTGAPARL